MAEKRKPNDWVDPDAWLNELADDLGDDFLVVVAPEVQRVVLPGVVVVPQGLIVMHARNWDGEITPSAVGSWRQKCPDGTSRSYPNPMKDLRAAEQALRRFLREEFPELSITVTQIIVLTNPEATIEGRPLVGNVLIVLREQLAREINALVAAMPGDRLDRSACEELATALVERRLTRNQKALTPFVFRSGSFLGGNRKVWTISDLFRHIDRNPSDGIYHMRNGTLENWLKDQGALYMARLVHEAADTAGKDPRAALEKMLAKTGLVNPRGVTIQPRKLDLGRVLTGADCGDTITIKAGAHHGYVVGTLETSDPWLRVDPKQVSGNETRVAVRVDTSKLPIQTKPYVGLITLHSDLIEKPIRIPVRLRVAVEPSAFMRIFLRPLLGAIVAGIIGALLGFTLGIYGIKPPVFLGSLLPGWPAEQAWALLIGVFWMIWGVVRGLQQPLTQPIDVWLLRWFLGTLLWMLPFGLIALACTWIMSLIPATSKLITPEVGTTLLVGALAVAIVPAVLDRGRVVSNGKVRSVDTINSRRPLIITLVAIGLALCVFAGFLYIPTLWQSSEVQTGRVNAQSWISVQYQTFRTKIDSWVEGYYLRRYDRRTKSISSPTPSTNRASPTPTK
ncbi:MAG: hypothetical protein LLG44_05325 [Chloroflexi bacterium]|nr:hypothetical protein [Chloroflexota bacterium]